MHLSWGLLSLSLLPLSIHTLQWELEAGFVVEREVYNQHIMILGKLKKFSEYPYPYLDDNHNHLDKDGYVIFESWVSITYKKPIESGVLHKWKVVVVMIDCGGWEWCKLVRVFFPAGIMLCSEDNSQSRFRRVAQPALRPCGLDPVSQIVHLLDSSTHLDASLVMVWKEVLAAPNINLSPAWIWAGSCINTLPSVFLSPGKGDHSRFPGVPWEGISAPRELGEDLGTEVALLRPTSMLLFTVRGTC